jgi:hypothetical protein
MVGTSSLDGAVRAATADPCAAQNTLEPVLHSFLYSIEYLEDQVAGLSDEQMAMQPPGVMNHAFWTIGHLCLVFEMIGEVVELSGTLPADWVKFGPGSRPVADADFYDAGEAILRLRDGRDRLVERVRDLSDADLDREFPDPEYREVFPSIRHALTQVLLGHTAFHIGQLSVWRNAVGLNGIGRSYE